LRGDTSRLRSSGTTGWTRHEVILVVPPDLVHLRAVVEFHRAGKPWVDDARLELLPGPQQPVNAPDLFGATNLDFEQ